MSWQVVFSKQVQKVQTRLPKSVLKNLVFLAKEIEIMGPVRGNWPNYGKLAPERHHCHLKKGRPTYVAVGEERNREIRLIEVVYVGTHEKAPY
jgi:mRNA-degrading endonuclease RelE of RelBE toxin-antitoxin system